MPPSEDQITDELITPHPQCLRCNGTGCHAIWHKIREGDEFRTIERCACCSSPTSECELEAALDKLPVSDALKEGIRTLFSTSAEEGMENARKLLRLATARYQATAPTPRLGGVKISPE
ncbi:hypothetical protein AA14337_3322 [Acetobacter malorum DSM 14337]|uniref:Uncharacterized protein n=1 Tax=Acetobacter malorum DSM 14337 TaxID=1307910 RepID=A0ABQ0Q0Y3_9PROT|nr:hypothetical protein AA14337_3322 [Acetobacter malorum DSM 14337]